MGTLNARPYQSGDPVAEYNESVTGESPETFGVSNVVPVVVTDPVHVIEHRARYITTDQVPADVIAVRLVSALRSRASVRITPVADIWVGSETVTRGTGYLIAAGASCVITATGEVFAVAAAPTLVYLLAEHRDA